MWAITPLKKNMKTKIILLAALIGAAAMSANAGVNFGFSFRLPVPVVVSPPVIYVAPAAVVQTTPPCPGVGYVWVPGYWSGYPTGRVWVAGAWQYRPTHAVYGYDRGDHRNWHGGYNRDGHDHDGYRR